MSWFFHLYGLLDLRGAREENKKKKKENSGQQWDPNPVPSTYESKALTTFYLWYLYLHVPKKQMALCVYDMGRGQRLNDAVLVATSPCSPATRVNITSTDEVAQYDALHVYN